VIVRVGQGFDIHRFEDVPTPGRVLVLGGQSFPGERALVGHSDADVIAHAVSDALLGAAGLGDIGQHFPDTDPQWRGADSIQILGAVVGKVLSAGWKVGNVDVNVICERPKIAPHREAMQERLTSVVGAPVSVKGRRAEGLGSIGRAEGIAAIAVALLVS
jgi:2-C-methyl-D-erythritol 2,4-cyclodiphosphate synthase